MSVKMDAKYFIDKYAIIPENIWLTGVYQITIDGTKHCCALGWLGVDMGQHGGEEEEALRRIIQGPVSQVNDGKHPDYQQPTPKARILAALEDARKAGY